MMNVMDPSTSDLRKSRTLLRRLVLIAFAASITMVSQYWVGNATIYSGGQVAERRAVLHRAVLENEPPGESWSADDMNTVNIRVAAVYAAELVRSLSGLDLDGTYQLLGAVYLLASVLLLFWFLRLVSGTPGAVLGTFYYGAILPLTYFLNSFHPWDRISLVFWILALVALFKDRIWLFLGVVLLGILVKYDIMVLPGLYFLVKARRDDWIRPAAHTVAMLAVTFAARALLQVALPGGFEPVDTFAQWSINLQHFLDQPLAYPPLLALGLPLLLGAVGFGHGTRWSRGCFVFSLIIMAAIFVQANFREVRALMPPLVLLLPLAIEGFHRLAENSGTRPGQTVATAVPEPS